MTSPLRILMLEDSPTDAELIQRQLRSDRIEFISVRVATEEAFRNALVSDPPQIILCDYNLPGFDGASALRIAHQLTPDIPFVFVSGSIGEERAIAALREGATDYILKDRPSRLSAAIRRARGSAHAIDELQRSDHWVEAIWRHPLLSLPARSRDRGSGWEEDWWTG